MDGFKSNPKMQCFKEGGQVKYETRKEHAEEVKADINQDKRIVKKAISMHDKQEHKGEKTDLSKLRKGGRAKKDCGTVKKYKSGGSVTNVYEAKKSSGDKDNIQKTKDIKPGKAAATSRAIERPNFEGSDVAKTNKMPAGDKDLIKKVKPTGNKKAVAPSGAGGPDAYKKGGGVKKFSGAQGSYVGTPSDQSHKLALMSQMKKLPPSMQMQLLSQQQGIGGNNSLNQLASGMNPAPAAAIAPSAPVNQMGDATGMGNIPYRKGGKVKKVC